MAEIVLLTINCNIPELVLLTINDKKSLKIPMGYSEAVNRRGTDNMIVKRKRDRKYDSQKKEGQTIG